MIVNGEKVNIKDFLNNSDLEQNMQKKVNENLELTGYQISVLSRFGIDVSSLGTLKEVIYMINNALGETPNEDLEQILEEISERDYYENTRK